MNARDQIIFDKLKSKVKSLRKITDKVVLLHEDYFKQKEFQEFLKPDMRASGALYGMTRHDIYHISESFPGLTIIPTQTVSLMFLRELSDGDFKK